MTAGTAVTPLPRTLAVEVRRILARRFVRVLVALALGGCLFAGAVAWIVNADAPEPDSAAVLVGTADDPTPGALDLVELWPEDELSNPFLGIAAIVLVLGGFLAGSTVVGAEWRMGTMTTTLTWEARRAHLAAAKLAAAGLVALVAGLVLQIAFAAALVPAIASHGSFAGADGGWYATALAGVGRGALLTALAAVAGAAGAFLGRSTTAPLVTGVLVISMLEPILRAIDIRTDLWMVTGNSARTYLWTDVAIEGYSRSPASAALLVVIYVGLLVALSVGLFRRRDVL